MQQVFKMVGRVSHSDAPVMITGESGSGKELVARAIHHYSQRNTKSFVAINCAAIPEQLLESELFGHERGAFTGAPNLRVREDVEFSRVGGNANLKSDVRIICATNKNLEQAVGARAFREDLFYRLN